MKIIINRIKETAYINKKKKEGRVGVWSVE